MRSTNFPQRRPVWGVQYVQVRRFLLPLVVLGLLVVAPAAQAVELGRNGEEREPSCPERCQALGRVTGYQLRQGDKVNPFRAPSAGTITAITLKLGQPSVTQQRFFTSTFGGPPRARVSILRRGTKHIHRMVAQSPVLDLAPHLGTTHRFRLSPALPISEGNVVALTVPTWAPAFAVGLPKEEGWRSSRSEGKCSDVRQLAAQQRVGGLRTYGCFYNTARLTYTATFAPSAGG